MQSSLHSNRDTDRKLVGGFEPHKQRRHLGEAPKGAHTLSRDSAPDSGCLLSTYLRNVLIIGPELGYYSHRVGYGAPVAIGRQLPASIV